MGKMRMENRPETKADVADALNNADAWVLYTVTANPNGAIIAVRESGKNALITMIAVLLEQEEIYKAVTLKIAEIKEKDEKDNINPQNLNVN